MNRYYDTGVLLKLYTVEPESTTVQRFVTRKKEPIFITSLHRSEIVSAFRLKAFRGECDEAAAAAVIADFEDDLSGGAIRMVGLDWDRAWAVCRELSNAHTGGTGCRTLDALHVACARMFSIREFVTTDKRQAALARRAGMRASSPSAGQGITWIRKKRSGGSAAGSSSTSVDTPPEAACTGPTACHSARSGLPWMR
jgi:predicted nucleic acid-binding protein